MNDQQQQQGMMMTTTKKKREKSDVDPLYERRRWRRRSTADFRHATPATTTVHAAVIASRSERQLPVVISDSEDSSESSHNPRRSKGNVNVNGKGSGSGRGRGRGRLPTTASTRFRRAASRSFRGIWQADGACDTLLLASHLQASPAGVASRFVMRRHAVMDGIRERIAGLRRRAETAPGRLEWFV